MVELNDEQIMIIKFLEKGFTNIEIAEELGYSPNTIKKRLWLIYKLFNVSKRVELMNKILKYRASKMGII